MIKTVIFDFGVVLIDWHRRYLFDKVFSTPEETDYFLNHIFTMEENNQFDLGIIPCAEVVRRCIEKHPDYAEYIKMYDERWIEMTNGTNTEMFNLMRKLRGKYQILGLTNYSHEKLLETYKKYPEFDMIEGVVDSGTEHIMKPDPRLYQILLDRYHVIPNEAVFIDDRPENIETAIKLGINGIIFQSNAQVIADLQKLGISQN